MANPPLSGWIGWGAACVRINFESGSDGRGSDMETHLLEALRDGDVRARRTDNGQDLHPEFWADGLKRLRLAEAQNPGVGVEIHRPSLLAWLNAGNSKGARRGAPVQYDWEGFWVEIARLANTPDGLPQGAGAQTQLCGLMEEWFEDNAGKSPSASEINKRLKRLYEQAFR